MTNATPAEPLQTMWGPYLESPNAEMVIDYLLRQAARSDLFEQHPATLSQRMTAKSFIWEQRAPAHEYGASSPVQAACALGRGLAMAEAMPVARLACALALGRLLGDLKRNPAYVRPEDAPALESLSDLFLAHCRPCPLEAERAAERTRLYEALADAIGGVA
jgi:hypothetical protein